jgi:hypothetical protein
VPPYSRRAAAAVADALLAAVPLPADTQHVSEPPRAVAGKLGRPLNIDEPKDVDRYAYWSSTDRPEAMLSSLAKNGPFPKVQFSGSGSTAGTPESWFETLEVPLTLSLAGPRQLFVAAALDGSGRYAVRVDAVVAWHPTRPAQSLVPPTARWLEVRLTRPAYRALNPGEPSHPHVTTRSVITTDPSTVRTVARAVNELPVAEPGGGGVHCPEASVANAQGAPRFLLIFRSAATSSNLAQVRGRSGNAAPPSRRSAGAVEHPGGTLISMRALGAALLATGASTSALIFAGSAYALSVHVQRHVAVRQNVHITFHEHKLPEHGYYYAVIVLKPYREYTSNSPPPCSPSSNMFGTNYGYPQPNGVVALTPTPSKSLTEHWCHGGFYEGGIYAVPHPPPCESTYRAEANRTHITSARTATRAVLALSSPRGIRLPWTLTEARRKRREDRGTLHRQVSLSHAASADALSLRSLARSLNVD